MEEKEAVCRGVELAYGELSGATPPRDCTAACCHGGAKMAVLAYSLGKREINQHFTIKNAKLISLVAVLLLLVFHAASRYYEGECCFYLINLMWMRPLETLDIATGS